MKRKFFLMNWKSLRQTFRLICKHLLLTFMISWKSLWFFIVNSRKYNCLLRRSFLNFLNFLNFDRLTLLLKLGVRFFSIFCCYLFLRMYIFQSFWHYLNLFCLFFHLRTWFKYQKTHLSKSFCQLIFFQSFLCQLKPLIVKLSLFIKVFEIAIISIKRIFIWQINLITCCLFCKSLNHHVFLASSLFIGISMASLKSHNVV